MHKYVLYNTFEYTIQRKKIISTDSQYRQEMNKAILDLKEKGVLKALQKKWWTPGKSPCEEDEAADGTEPMGLNHVGGVFIVLVIGIFISLFLGFLEFLWAVRQTSIEYKVI